MTESETQSTDVQTEGPANQVVLAQQRNELAELRNQLAQQRNDLAQERTDLAAIRTRQAAERTLMAWIRTAIAMIGFGFSMYKFFEYFTALPDVGREYHAHAPRNLGLAFIALGTVALIAAVAEHVATMRRLADGGRMRISLVIIVAVLIALMGIFAFVGVLSNTGPF
jgi:uncharacterized membrane protein YidH (DUF202 family)